MDNYHLSIRTRNTDEVLVRGLQKIDTWPLAGALLSRLALTNSLSQGRSCHHLYSNTAIKSWLFKY
jgi:hypothetical protein